MLGSIRKFSSSIYAKVFLIIVAIPFIFWGMGPVFQGGKQNVIVEIGKENISTKEFIDFINFHNPKNDILDDLKIEKLLSNFIGQKVINFEIESFNIKMPDKALSEIIKNEKIFKKDNKFSRNEYEKFLIKNSLSAVYFEENISDQRKREQLFEFIGGGIVPSKFIINMNFNKINQKRNIEIINLKDAFNNEVTFTDEQIKTYYSKNIDSFNTVYSTIKYIELNPKSLIGNDEYNDLFFEKIDMIDDLVAEGKKVNYIIEKFKLSSSNSIIIDNAGKDKNSKVVENFPNKLISHVFNIEETEPGVLIEIDNKYFLIELIKKENIQKKPTNEIVKKEILIKLNSQLRRRLVSKIITDINSNNFKKSDFDKFAKDNNVEIRKIKLQNQNDYKILKKEVIEQVYKYPKKKVVIVSDIFLKENYLIYIDSIENKSIDIKSKDYQKYSDLAKSEIASSLYNSYDLYLKEKYEIKINYNTLNNIKNNIR